MENPAYELLIPDGAGRDEYYPRIGELAAALRAMKGGHNNHPEDRRCHPIAGRSRAATLGTSLAGAEVAF